MVPVGTRYENGGRDIIFIFTILPSIIEAQYRSTIGETRCNSGSGRRTVEFQKGRLPSVQIQRIWCEMKLNILGAWRVSLSFTIIVCPSETFNVWLLSADKKYRKALTGNPVSSISSELSTALKYYATSGRMKPFVASWTPPRQSLFWYSGNTSEPEGKNWAR